MIGHSERRGFVTGGTWCADHNKIVTHWPGEEEVVEIVSEEVRGGGSACNLAIDMRRLDSQMPVSTIGLVGDDADGDILRGEVDAAGIDRAGLRTTADAKTNYTDAFTSAISGQRTHLFYAGTAALLSPDHFDFSNVRARFLHLGLPGIHKKLDAAWGGDDNGWVTILKNARASGLATNLELCSISADRIARIVRPCLAHLDLLIVNDFEISAIAGKARGHEGEIDVDDCLASARSVLDAGAMHLIAVHFPGGAIVITRDGQEIRKPSVSVPQDEVVGANGAGDAFAAGFLYGLHEDMELSDATTLGHAVAAVSLRGLGTTDAVEPWSKCLQIASEWGWREPI